jgi:hypothetical protein
MNRPKLIALVPLALTLACNHTQPAAAPPAAPSVAVTRAHVVPVPQDDHPAPNSQEIQAAVDGRSAEIRECYMMGTFRDSQLEGTVHVRFTIESTGKVTDTADVGSSIPDPQVVQCVLGVFATLEFPAGRYYPTEVEYPISFGKS